MHARSYTGTKIQPKMISDSTASDWRHKKEWERFLFEISEHPTWHSWFGNLAETEARRIWSLIEEKLFPAYRMFVRVWPEWYSSGIWQVPYPGSRFAGYNLDPASHLGISVELQRRFERWQDAYNSHAPWAPEKFDWKTFETEQLNLARSLKRELGESIYVEAHELDEVLVDGTIRHWRPILGLPDLAVEHCD